MSIRATEGGPPWGSTGLPEPEPKPRNIKLTPANVVPPTVTKAFASSSINIGATSGVTIKPVLRLPH